ncbi:MAG: rhomboid family intramembrane serine protease [Chitinophagales bacterium]|nr:rhomboid family intramembrane serine protease [Chitinophagales bacterium]MDW8274319.1 rhomboid family intramembrane serine protease [Chitinophagales bacterium]
MSSQNRNEEKTFWLRLGLSVLLIAPMWLVKAYEWYAKVELSRLGIFPGNTSGLKGIFFAPFIHGNLEHLLYNSAALLFLLTVLLNSYPFAAGAVIVFSQLFSGLIVWLFAAEDAYHIGSSGIIYGIAAFLISSGFLRKDRYAFSVAILILLTYGGIAAGFFPKEGISWQSHIAGAIAGMIMALIFRNVNVIANTEDEDELPKEHFFDESN